MLKHPEYTRNRLARVADSLFSRIYPEKRAVSQLLVSPRVERISYADAQKLKYRPAKIGQQFGPLWATYWFRGQTTVPQEWKGRRVDLMWASHSEATLWVNGRSVQGLNYEPASWHHSVRPDAILAEKAKGGERLSFEIEMACNRIFGGDSGPFRTVSPYILEQCDIALFDQQVWDLYYDFLVLQQLEAELSREGGTSDRTWAGELLYELNTVANDLDLDDRSTWPAVRSTLKKLYAHRNGTQMHELSAIGHAHIDTAWLWPIAETHRKCTRTFSSQVAYMDQYPDYRFACSQAYQYSVIKRDNPDLYKRMKAKAKAGQFIPVGGTWVEPDCNIPSGESLIRQFLQGQRFFEQEFGHRCREFWNPDVFGYNGQLPQIMRQAGIARFLTQKLSWNQFNKPQHHTFTWQGIDGSEVLAHFPPADNYNCMATVPEMRLNTRNYKDHDRSRHSLMLFGYGDGGGGPTKQMLEVLSRVKDLQGLPRTNLRSSDEFFTLLEKDCTDRPVVVGELYLEYHRGTLTTQAATKAANRRNEFLLHDVEFLAAVAHRLHGVAYPAAQLNELWRKLLVNQFHDIIPGTAITLVYQDTLRDHAAIRADGQQLRQQAAAALTGAKPLPAGAKAHPVPVNTTSFARTEVATVDGRLVYVAAPSYGIGHIATPTDQVVVTQKKNSIVLENAHLKAELATDGRLLSLLEKKTGRQALSAPGNSLKIYDDCPTGWDAWDVDPFHLETQRDCPPASSCKLTQQSGLRAQVEFQRSLGEKSSMRQIVRLDANARRLEFHCDVDWHESHKLLKVAFPVNARAMNATYEMQFGCVERPTHFSTSFEVARFEVAGHKWSDLSEHGFGVALLSDSKYGYSTRGSTMYMSLLRSPKDPDPQADMGKHTFAYAVMPHQGDWRDAGVVAEAARFNLPLVWTSAPHAIPADEAEEGHSFATVQDENLVLDTIKKAEDSDALVLRLYEAHGARGVAQVKIGLPFTSAVFCNALEDDGQPAKIKNGLIEVPYTPYQIITLKLT